MPFLKEIFRKEISSPFSYPFDLPESGLYTIIIKASCKPGWRNKWWLSFKGFLEDILDLHLDDEDLRVEIGTLVFGKPDGKRGLFNSPAAFSGTKTLSKIKTIVFLIKLSQGNHFIKFIPQPSAYLEELTVEKVGIGERVEFYPESRAENENSYSWYTFTLVDQPLKSFSVHAQASVATSGKDDDDLKLVVDGEVRRNPLSRHKNSYFCGFTLKGGEHTYTEDLDLETGTHYLEIFADKAPTLHSVKFTLAPPESEVSKTNIRIYRPGPNGEDYNRFDEAIRDAVAFWNEDFLSQDYPPPEPLDPNLVKAMIYVESLMGYGSSFGHPAYPDVMQVGNVNDPAIHTLNNDGWVDPRTGDLARENEWVKGRVEILDYKGEANAKTHEQSIKWGIRWLYHKAQKIKDNTKHWKSWEQAVKDYNGGGDPDYLKKVYGIYKNGADLKGKKLWSLLLILPLVLALPSLLIINTLPTLHKVPSVKTDGQITLSKRDERGKTLGVTAQPFIGSTIYQAERLDPESRLAFVRHPLYPAVGLTVIDNSDNIKYFLEGGELKETPPYGEIKGPGEYVKWLEVGDFDGDKKKEIAVQYIVSGTGLFHPFYVYKEEGSSFRLLLKLNDGVSEAQLTDLNNDGKKEILYSYVIDASGAGPRSWTVWREIWRWEEGELELASHKFPSIYKNLILFYDYLLTNPEPDSWLNSYYPMIECLRDKAKANISGVLADVKICRDT